MSYHTLLGAFVVPAETPEPFTYFDEGAPRFQRSSRAGRFHSALRDLLDVMPHHESLRCLSAQTATVTHRSGDGCTSFTLLGPAEQVELADALRDLLDRMPDHLDALPAQWLSDWGGAHCVRQALAERSQASGDEASGDEDGDSPESFVGALRGVLALLRTALATHAQVVVYTWLPQ